MSTSIASQQLAVSTKAWNIALWVVQVILGGMFIMGGLFKAATPVHQLAAMAPWVSDVPVALLRMIGVSEVLGGIGLILPALLRVLPRLTIVAALSLATVMLLAMLLHVVRGEYAVIGTNLMLGAAAIFIAWGRTRRAPIAPRRN